MRFLGLSGSPAPPRNNRRVDPSGLRQSAMICLNRLYYWREGGRRSRPKAFASDEGSCSCCLRVDSGRDFLRHDAPALRFGRSTAGRYAD
jgi:hypothetical protein